MRILINLIFWTVAAVLVVPAVLGVFAGLAVLAATMLVGIILFIAGIASMILCCVPVIWWCAIFDTTRAYAYVTRLQTLTRHQKPEGN